MSLTARFYDIPSGYIAAVVTSLEMRARPDLERAIFPQGFDVKPHERMDLDDYRALFRQIGGDFLWFSRLQMKDAALAKILSDKANALYCLSFNGKPIGILELDFRDAPHCEIAFFGLDRSFWGKGLARQLMNFALAKAWRPTTKRVWIHTCTFDSPRALPFYLRSGFKPYKREIEIAPDPRLMGVLPAQSAAHVPIIPKDDKSA